MLYSNCGQIKNGRTTAMQRLVPGSVICFGSTITSEFCVDTVFVVARSEPWTPWSQSVSAPLGYDLGGVTDAEVVDARSGIGHRGA
jgi:hypothetical protein